jgi:hypothetical protein
LLVRIPLGPALHSTDTAGPADASAGGFLRFFRPFHRYYDGDIISECPGDFIGIRKGPTSRVRRSSASVPHLPDADRTSHTGKNYLLPFPDDYIPPKELPPPKEDIVLVDRQI